MGRCPGRSESSLGAHSFNWFCHVAARFIFMCPCLFDDLLTSKSTQVTDNEL